MNWALLFAYAYAHKNTRWNIYEKGLDLCNPLILKDLKDYKLKHRFMCSLLKVFVFPSLPWQGENVIKHSNKSVSWNTKCTQKYPLTSTFLCPRSVDPSSPRNTWTALTLIGIQRVVVWNHTALHQKTARMTKNTHLRSRESKNRTLMNHKNHRHFKQTRDYE